MKFANTPKAIIACAALTIAGTAWAEEDKEKQAQQQQQQSEQGQQRTGGQQEQGLAATDKAFIKMAAMEHMAEINISKIAQQKAQSEELKQHAQKMVEQHTQALQELKQIAQQKGVELKPDMPEKAQEMKKDLMQEITGKSGQAFDQAYLAFEVAGHRMAEALFQNAAEFAQDQELQQYAQKQLPEIRRHLAMVEKESRGTTGTQRSGQAGQTAGSRPGQQPQQSGQEQQQQREKVGTEQ